jgi:tryptophan synthase beta subunit
MKFSIWLEAKKQMFLSMKNKTTEELLALADTLESAYEADERRPKHMAHYNHIHKYFPGGPSILLHYAARIARNLAKQDSTTKYENSVLLKEFPPEFREVLGI